MTHPTTPTCPECGAEAMSVSGSVTTLWECESPTRCLIASLTRQLAERDDRIERLEGAIKSIKRVNLCDGFTADTKKHLIMALVKILDELGDFDVPQHERPEMQMCPKCKSTADFSVEVSTNHNNYKTCIACRSKFPLDAKRELTCPPLSPESAEADHAEWLKGKSSKPKTKDSLKEIVEEFKCLLSNAKCELGLHQQLSRIQHRLGEILSVQLPLTQKGGPVMAKKPPKKPKGGKGC